MILKDVNGGPWRASVSPRLCNHQTTMPGGRAIDRSSTGTPISTSARMSAENPQKRRAVDILACTLSLGNLDRPTRPTGRASQTFAAATASGRPGNVDVEQATAYYLIRDLKRMLCQHNQVAVARLYASSGGHNRCAHTPPTKEKHRFFIRCKPCLRRPH